MLLKFHQILSILQHADEERFRLSAAGLFTVGMHLLPAVSLCYLILIGNTLFPYIVQIVFKYRLQVLLSLIWSSFFKSNSTKHILRSYLILSEFKEAFHQD